MRIGMDATPIFLPLGGIGYYILNVLKHLAHIDHENEYILYNTGPADNRVQPPFQHAGNFQFVNIWRPALRWSIKRDRIDIFHGPNYRLPARGLHGSIVSIYDLSVARFPQLFRKAIGRKRDFIKSKRVAQMANRVITISRHSAMDIADLYEVPSERIDVIYCGIGDEFFPEKDQGLIKKIRGQYGLENRDYVLFIGGSDPRKNVVTLLKAYGTLSEIHSRTALVLVGSMQKRSEQIYKIIRENDLERDVMMVGDITQDALRVLYSQAAVFVLPSLYEGFGMPVLEAMACGAPVITSNTSSMPEVAGDAAVFIKPTDAEALGISIRTVLKDRKARETMKAKGFVRAKLFSWETAAKQTLEVYRNVYKQGL
jgi:glycosyltransferase involved in cell wall biosynthesis